MVYIRFWRRFRIAPGTLLNVSKRGISVSFVSRLLNITFGKHGIRLSSGLRGSGISFIKFLKYKK